MECKECKSKELEDELICTNLNILRINKKEI